MTLTEFLTGIANAIRAKKGTTAKIKATNFASEITNLQIGDAKLQEKTITENGTYTPDAGFDGFSTVSVNVPNDGGAGLKFLERVEGHLSELTNDDMYGVESITQYAFYYCTFLQSVEIPDSTYSIGQYAFANCWQLTNVVVGKGVSKINEAAFYRCEKLRTLDFSRHTSVPELSSTAAFANTPATLKIVVPSSLYNTWKSATNWSVYASQIISYSEGLSYSSFGNSYQVEDLGNCTDVIINIPPTHNGLPVGSISDDAFYNKTKIVSVRIPNSVTVIGDSAFYGCSSLQIVDFSSHTRIPALNPGESSSDSWAFDGTHSNLQIKVPKELESSWKTATRWSKYANRIVGVD